MSSAHSDSLAKKLGTTTHLSPLLHKLKRLGLSIPSDLEDLAIVRGLDYYGKVGDLAKSRDVCLSQEELAIALLSPSLPYSLNRLRMAGAILGCENLCVDELVLLSRKERCEAALRHIAEMGHKVEPSNSFWESLLLRIPPSSHVPVDVMPHLTRFVTYSGIDRTGRVRRMQWIRATP
jgi:hypothetical protein